MKGSCSGLHQNPYLQRAEVAKPGFRRSVQDCWKVRALHMCVCVDQWFQRFGGDDSGFIQESRACDHRSQSFEDGSKEKTFMILDVVRLVEHEKLPICEGLLNTQAFLSCNRYGLFIVGLSYTLWQWPCPT